MFGSLSGIESPNVRAPRHILLTGASGALGRALAEIYAAEGILLSLTGRDPDRLKQTARRCEALGAEVVSECLDVREYSAVRQWVRERDGRRPVDLAILNAAVAHTLKGSSPVAEDWDTVLEVIQTNVLGALASIDPLVTNMAARKRGQIAFIASLGAYVGMPLSPIYNASKAALKIYAEGLRGRLSAYGVGVSAVLPGFIASDMSAAYPGPKPFMLPAARAARIIRDGLSRNRAIIAFPWTLQLTMLGLALLPSDWSLRLQRWAGYA